MKKLFVLILMLMVSGCVMRFKGKDIEIDSRPLSGNEQTIELYEIELFTRDATTTIREQLFANAKN